MKKLFTLLFFTFCFCSMLRPSEPMDVDQEKAPESRMGLFLTILGSANKDAAADMFRQHAYVEGVIGERRVNDDGSTDIFLSFKKGSEVVAVYGAFSARFVGSLRGNFREIKG